MDMVTHRTLTNFKLKLHKLAGIDRISNLYLTKEQATQTNTRSHSLTPIRWQLKMVERIKVELITVEVIKVKLI